MTPPPSRHGHLPYTTLFRSSPGSSTPLWLHGMVVEVVLGPTMVLDVVAGIEVEVVDTATVVEVELGGSVVEVEPGASVWVVTTGDWLQSSVQSGLQVAQLGS